MEHADDHALVESLRAARRAAVARSAERDVARVLDLPADDPGSRVYVVKLLDVHPALGKVTGRRLMGELGIDPFARVVDLTGHQRLAILEACGETR